MLEQSATELIDSGQFNSGHLNRGHLRISSLRNAIQANRIHFPEPVPVFAREFRPDIQWRLVELYFIRGWSARSLAERYGVTTRRVQQSLLHWAGRAAESGYLQEIPAENLTNLQPLSVRPAAPVPAPMPMPAPESLPQYVPIPAAATPAFAAQSA